ncbi:MAG: Periplasmic beta-glucosidase precursor [Bacteroidota bacterium]|jgi:beta-glucosidase
MFRYLLLLSGCVLTQALQAQQSIYYKDFIDFNKNGKKDVFEDPRQSVERRIENLLSQMTVDEKTVQLATLYGYGRVLKDSLPQESWKTKLWKDGIGNIDEHLNNTTFRKQTFTTLSFPYSRHTTAINTVQRWFVEQTRLGIPVDFTNEGIHGLAHDRATLFPAPIAMGSTWNTSLLHQAGEVLGREAKALGYTNIYVPILDLARDPRWGRVVECYGEDPFHVTELGKQVVLGVQANKVGATLKHYAVYSVPKGGRDGNARTDPHVAPRELHQLYLYPFKRVIQETKPMGVMSSYNDWDGEPITGSYYFLTTLLRQEFGFDGYVVSDSEAVEYIYTKHRVATSYKEAVQQAIQAGLNVRTNFDIPDKYVLPLRELVKEGNVTGKTLDSRVADVLRVKFKLGLFDSPYVDSTKADGIVNNAAAKNIAYELSRQSIVLLKNAGQLLPLSKITHKKILVTGPLAADTLHSLSRYGPNNIHVQSVLEGMQQYTKNFGSVIYEKGCETVDVGWPESELFPLAISSDEQAAIDKAVQKAKEVDVIIAVLGEDESLVGESRSRTSLELPGKQLALLQALYQTGKPVVLILINGRPLTINWADRFIPSIIEAWFPGAAGGQVLAATIFGEHNPGGKLPVTFPKSIGQLEYNFPFKPGSHAGQPGDGPNGFGKTNVYGSLYPFGHGLSYTQFQYENLIFSDTVISTTKSLQLSFDLRNTGLKAGEEVVQLYIKDLVSSLTVYETQLRGFQRVNMEPGQSKKISFVINPVDLQLLNKKMNWEVEPGEFEILIGSSSTDIRLRKKFIVQ